MRRAASSVGWLVRNHELLRACCVGNMVESRDVTDHATLKKVRLRDSILVKSVVLTTVLIAGIVGILTVYFQTKQFDALEDDHLARVDMYGDLLADQLRSAIAFSDQETAREVLSALHTDPDVSASVLYDSAGALLVAEGTPSPWVARAARGVTSKRVFATDGRVAVVVPVKSLEGPWGTLVVEVSLQRMLTRERAVMYTAAGVAIAAVLAGMLIAWLIVRRLVRRLRAIGDVACDVAAGASVASKVEIESRDEIGILGAAFNQMVEQLHTANRDLESRVISRTLELSSANEKLISEMARRSQVELELRQSQKLESVGRLAAGVAHEINTPVQFVSDSVNFIRDSASGILALVDCQERALQALVAGRNEPELLRAAEEAAEVADLEFVRAELPLALDRTLDGLDRVSVIVRSMKVFSHQHAVMNEIDLNKAVASTLTIARHEYKYVADIVTDYGEVPPVTCEAGEINQVVLNLLLNAAHAIGDAVKGTKERGCIRVRTWVDGERACVSIADTGGGIPAHIRERIYDPFFTTKAVGRGTGQGLAIARSVIVDKHQGTLDFESEAGRGTTFVLTIPLRPQMETKAAA